jgi:hypothetical protein
MDIDDEIDPSTSMDVDHDTTNIVPMPQASSVAALREKLHAKMAELRQNRRGSGTQAGDRDELLEERHIQRAAMRERRRKETKEKKRKEKEKPKKKDEKAAVKGSVTKVRLSIF